MFLSFLLVIVLVFFTVYSSSYFYFIIYFIIIGVILIHQFNLNEKWKKFFLHIYLIYFNLITLAQDARCIAAVTDVWLAYCLHKPTIKSIAAECKNVSCVGFGTINNQSQCELWRFLLHALLCECLCLAARRFFPSRSLWTSPTHAP